MPLNAHSLEGESLQLNHPATRWQQTEIKCKREELTGNKVSVHTGENKEEKAAGE